MAAVAPAPASLNGLGTPSLPTSPASAASSTKRKRDASHDLLSNGADDPQPTINGDVHPKRDEKKLVKAVFDLLRRFDIKPSILGRPIPESPSEEEPQAKRQKPDDATPHLSIDDKVSQDRYTSLDDLIADVKRVVSHVITSLQTKATDEDPQAIDEALNQALDFRKRALELYQREVSYPVTATGTTSASLPGEQPDGKYALSVYGLAPHGKTLYTSLQLPVRTADQPQGVFTPLSAANLPQGVLATKVVPHSPKKKNSRVPTLGELYPPAPNLPPLQAPKTTKSATKSNVLGFHHPDPVEKCPYRSGQTYYSQPVAVGHWVDYSNSTPSSQSQIKTKQRERAQSLAGVKPSSTELEMSEMETLFRRAFSSFAPSRDDSGAVVSSSQASRIWWERVGQRQYVRMIETEEAAEDVPEEVVAQEEPQVIVDEDAVKEAISNWDDLIDPSLEDATSKKGTKEKSIDDKLMEASDLIETLASYQRNRHLTLPTSKNRRSTDPVSVDMLQNGSLVPQPGEEELEVYLALKNTLLDIILDLPPYALSRLDGDKLGDLFVSTKIEIRTDIRQGINEEDDATVKARQQQQQTSMQANTPRQQHRTPSMSGSFPGQQQYYASQNRPPPTNAGAPPYYQQSPARAQPQPMHQRPAMTGGMQPQMVQNPPHMQHSPHPQPPQHRPSASQQFRPPTNGYSPAFQPQLAKPQAPPYGQHNMQFPGTPGQGQPQRMPQHAGFPHGSPVGTPNVPPSQQQQQHRFPIAAQGFPGPGYPHQQHQMPHQQPPNHQPMFPHQQPQQQQHGGPRPGYPQYANGAVNMPPRPHMAPQAAPQQHYNPMQQHSQHQQYPQQIPQQPRFPPYGASQGVMPVQPHRYSLTGGPPSMAPNGGQQQPLGPLGFHTTMSERDQNRLLEDTRRSVQQQQQQQLQAGMQGVGMNAGLAGIGLKGNFDVQKQLAATRASMGQQHMSASPRPQTMSLASMPGAPVGMSSPGPMNGMMAQQQRHSASPAGFVHPSPSPVPMAGSQQRPAA